MVSLQYQDINEDGLPGKMMTIKETACVCLLRYDLASGHTFALFFRVYSAMKAFIPSSLSEQDYRNNPEAAAQNWQEAAGYGRETGR
ncbi:MAG: hypothetical protein U5L09_11235 [Bacteroidales bacterium]|nr:hypothetical protein [Bacteroidales bacterium]